MIDSVPSQILRNCTIEVINRHPILSSVNESSIRIYNRSIVVDLLSDIFGKYSDIYSDDSASQILFKEFLADCLFSTQNRKPYELPWEQKTIWSLLFGAMLLVAISGNMIVLWIVLAHRRMRTVTNYFLLNLSVSDLLMAVLNCVFNFIFMIDSDWPFGYFYCIVNNFIANVSVAASVFTLVAISFDRFIAIVRPLHHRTSRTKARIFLFVIWSTSCVLAAPCLMYSSISTKRYSNGKKRTVCYMHWPDGGFPTSKADYIYNIVFLILTYLIPIIVMIFCYSLMGRELWGSRSIGERTERQMESMRSKRKVVRMFVIIVTIFAVCWLPYHLFFIYSYHNTSMTSTSYVQHLYLGFYFLAMSNSCVNPCIYYYMNERFRIYFQQVICCCCHWRGWKPNVKDELPPGILLEKHSHSDTMARSRLSRQKTLSVKWHQSMSETKLHDKRNLTSARRFKECSFRNRLTPMPKLSSGDFESRQDSLPAAATATTPLMANNSNLNNITCTKEICDCTLPHDYNTTASIKCRQSLPHVATLMNGNDRCKSESC